MVKVDNIVDEVNTVVKSIRLTLNKLSFDLESLNKLLSVCFSRSGDKIIIK